MSGGDQQGAHARGNGRLLVVGGGTVREGRVEKRRDVLERHIWKKKGGEKGTLRGRGYPVT